jgi:hypothetical protein
VLGTSGANCPVGKAVQRHYDGSFTGNIHRFRWSVLVPRAADVSRAANGSFGSRLCENSNDRAPVYKFQSIFGPFPPLRLGRTKKFAPDAPFSDNFRVFTQAGSI